MMDNAEVEARVRQACIDALPLCANLEAIEPLIPTYRIGDVAFEVTLAAKPKAGQWWYHKGRFSPLVVANPEAFASMIADAVRHPPRE